MRIGREARQAGKGLFRACCVDGRLDEGRVREAVRRLVAEKPRRYAQILARLQKLVALEIARHRARVETAAPLAGGVKELIEAQLRRRQATGSGAEFVVNPGLIGGMRIQVGSDVWDTSVRGRLAELESKL
ncbi:MAG: F0F1 ATP synthase subunit delta [Verrucomicrobiae bacterium]|nr:F0F1 ATP synthase subunit delta [Verrucomicrobiae bacterium]